jgi:NAD(P)-dependent dehydrogenase (short-subunit alcohol dehydrogenase family)
MLLQDKSAVLYGGGSITTAVAEAFAQEGARVFLAGRNEAKLRALAERIGGADVAVLDALDRDAVERHADHVVQTAGRLDISFNLISHDVRQGTPMIDMDVEDYVRPVDVAVRSLFLTSTAAARRMVASGGGVILVFGGDGPPMQGYSFGALQVGFGAMESMRRQLSAEYGRQGVRAVTLRTGGIPQALPEGMHGADAIARSIADSTMTGRAATYADVGNAAAFAASDRAGAMTAATINISAGALVD